MQLIDGKEYWTIIEAAEYMKISEGQIKKIYNKSKGKYFSRIQYKNNNNNKLEYLFKKDEVVYYNDNVRNIINYQKIIFNGSIEKIDDNSYLLDGVEYRDSLYLPKYFISKIGNIIYLFDGNKFRLITSKQEKHNHNTISIKQKTYFVHRLVLEAFGYPKPFEKAVVRHLNDNPDDNRIENLKWGTYKENLLDYRKNVHINKNLYVFLKHTHPEILIKFREQFEELSKGGTKTGIVKITKNNLNIDDPRKFYENFDFISEK